MNWKLWAMLAALSAACAGSESRVEEAVVEVDTAPVESAMDEITGMLTMDPVAGGKRFQGTWIDTGVQRFVLAYRPVPEYFEFQDKRVVAVGEKWMPGMYEQHIDAPHFRPKAIRLADGESAYESPPKSLLTPPTARSLAEAEAVPGRWVRLLGVMGEPQTDQYGWLSARMTLDDGEVELDRMSAETAAKGLRSVMCIIVRGADGRIEAFGAVAGCPGDEPRCGMDEQ